VPADVLGIDDMPQLVLNSDRLESGTAPGMEARSEGNGGLANGRRIPREDFSAPFSGGRVCFGGAVFSGSDVNFGDAKFSGSTVDFAKAKFSGGTVDLSRAWDWSQPPKFGFTGAPPETLKLPEGWRR
jgi:hypothetical protein